MDNHTTTQPPEFILSLTRLYEHNLIEITFSTQTQTLTASQFSSSEISSCATRHSPPDPACVCVVTYFVNSHLFEGNLQELEVVDVFVLQLGTKFHFLQRHRVGKQHVHELAVGSACTNKNKQTSTGRVREEQKRLKIEFMRNASSFSLRLNIFLLDR